MRVGFASSNGTSVNECLLSDTTWWIYDITDSARLVEKRVCMCRQNCEDCGHSLSESLHDCDLLFVHDVSSSAYVRMASDGIQILEASLPIQALIPNLIRCVSQKVSRNYFKRIFQLRNAG